MTLKDIARETGLTMASVSRALRDMPDIADETKQYVHDVAENLGYHPNVFAASLRTGKSKFIGLIIQTRTLQPLWQMLSLLSLKTAISRLC